MMYLRTSVLRLSARTILFY